MPRPFHHAKESLCTFPGREGPRNCKGLVSHLDFADTFHCKGSERLRFLRMTHQIEAGSVEHKTVRIDKILTGVLLPWTLVERFDLTLWKQPLPHVQQL